jgi:hypothetical protein
VVHVIQIGNIANKVKEKVIGAKGKVTDTAKETKDKNHTLLYHSNSGGDRTFEEGVLVQSLAQRMIH